MVARRILLLGVLASAWFIAATPNDALASEPSLVAAGEIQCGSILGPGGHHVLDRDLTCPPTPGDDERDYEDRIGVLKVIGGATLDLNGHTVACAPNAPPPPSIWASSIWGIVVRQSTLRNGTVRGCPYGVIARQSLVIDMVLDGNIFGAYLRQKVGSGGNVLLRNTAQNNQVGFYLEETRGELLIDNVARDNGTGFGADRYDAVFIGNRAVRNTYGGFAINGADALIGNHAENNEVGFVLDSVREIKNNIAKGNADVGFDIRHGHNHVLDDIRANIARGNGGDGFSVIPLRAPGSPEKPGTLANNYALYNGGKGLHIRPVEYDPSPPETATITDNVAIGNAGGDLADDTGCGFATWRDNVFEKAVEPCIK